MEGSGRHAIGYGEIIFLLVSCQTVLHMENPGTFLSWQDQDAMQIFNATASLSGQPCTSSAEGQVTEIMLQHFNWSAEENVLMGSLNALAVLDSSSCFLPKHSKAFWLSLKYHCETVLLRSSCRLLSVCFFCAITDSGQNKTKQKPTKKKNKQNPKP